jgi:hypothetical protein
MKVTPNRLATKRKSLQKLPAGITILGEPGQGGRDSLARPAAEIGLSGISLTSLTRAAVDALCVSIDARVLVDGVSANTAVVSTLSLRRMAQ